MTTNNKIRSVGDVLEFGSYWQSNSSCKEPIEWIVLTVKDDRALLLSKYALDYVPYTLSGESITWEYSNLRNWLNSEFILNAFTPTESKIILSTSVPNYDNPYSYTGCSNGGNDTVDKIFILSIQEVEEFLKDTSLRVCKLTNYAKSQYQAISEISLDAFFEDFCCWWLRTPGYFQDLVSNVDVSGDIYLKGDYTYTTTPIVTRIAIYVDIQLLYC